MSRLNTYQLGEFFLLDSTFLQLFTQDFSWVNRPGRNQSVTFCCHNEYYQFLLNVFSLVKCYNFVAKIQNNSRFWYFHTFFSSQLNVFILCLCIQALGFKFHFVLFLYSFSPIFYIDFTFHHPMFRIQLFSYSVFFGMVHGHPLENSVVEKYIKCKLYYYIYYILVNKLYFSIAKGNRAKKN